MSTALRASQRGFGLVELIIALALGLILILGVTQIFVGAKQGFVVQQSAAAMQENARFLLGRMARELRMVNLFGCLDLNRLPAPVAATVPDAFSRPIAYEDATLTLLTAVPHAQTISSPTTRNASDFGARWLIVTDCRTADNLRIGTADVPVGPGDILIPIRQLEYSLHNHAIRARINGAGNRETLIDGVVGLDVSFAMAGSSEEPHVSGGYVSSVDPANFDRIRSVRLALQLSDNPSDPDAGSVQAATYSLVTTLRNRTP
ncbi:prepilin-type N-terminal cleavage/methylation domain-containing protein [Halopseudomonas nanhaiensis]|uniref:PilW family protein n=1 Tax=Halopseudomonas nanhaiensis TaxID=2830842 RepID=UPI001CC03E8E|nr:prepilin-type N-terminal cleavage/methylation domain-containing protein [Halopseudomonas nanhaiensis]UAW97907.1 prepilin-type N-terminal cleavage/methylation domain-containing protein [Halopseudomonas nanhaiensis]